MSRAQAPNANAFGRIVGAELFFVFSVFFWLWELAVGYSGDRAQYLYNRIHARSRTPKCAKLGPGATATARNLGFWDDGCTSKGVAVRHKAVERPQ